MAKFPTPKAVTINKFLGIRTKDVKTGIDGSISAQFATNIELEVSDDGSGVSIKTTLGNKVFLDLADYTELNLDTPKIIDIFETEQDGTKYLMIYLIDKTLKGCLLCCNPNLSTPTVELLVSNLTVTSAANGITIHSTAYDVFVFTNGVEYYSYSVSQDTPLVKLQPKYDGKDVTGLALAEYRGSLVIGCDNGVVIGSRQGNITDWNYTENDQTKAWYQLFYKKITALVPYIDGLLVFTDDSSVLLSGNLSYATDAVRSPASIGGCFNHKSWTIHDKYLFFYDNNQKNIYYYLQNDIGEKVLGKPIADEIQNMLSKAVNLSIISYIGNNKNEIWLRITDKHGSDRIIIYNYLYGEYTERKMNVINGFNKWNFKILSFDDTKIFEERTGGCINCTFNGVYIPASYKSIPMNFGSYTNLKEEDIKPLITYDKSYNNNFAVSFTNQKKTKKKRFELNQGLDFTWGDDEPQDEETPDREIWSGDTENYAIFASEDSKQIATVKAKAPSSFYYMNFEIYTEKDGDDFCIKQIEMKDITIETDTTGTK